jgi:hypothetical protein
VPLVPVTVSKDDPSGVDIDVCTDIVDVCGVASVMTTEGGTKLTIVFAGCPLADRSTVPVKPPTGATVTV